MSNPYQSPQDDGRTALDLDPRSDQITRFPFLALIGFGIVLSPVLLFVAFGQEVFYLANGEFAKIAPEFQLYVVASLAGSALLMVFGTFTAVNFVQRTRATPRWAIVTSLAYLFLSVTLLVWATRLTGELDATLIRDTMYAMLRSLIVVPYFLLSKAVRTVFVKG